MELNWGLHWRLKSSAKVFQFWADHEHDLLSILIVWSPEPDSGPKERKKEGWSSGSAHLCSGPMLFFLVLPLSSIIVDWERSVRGSWPTWFATGLQTVVLVLVVQTSVTKVIILFQLSSCLNQSLLQVERVQFIFIMGYMLSITQKQKTSLNKKILFFYWQDALGFPNCEHHVYC